MVLINLSKIHDKIQLYLNKKQKISTEDLPAINCDSWEEAKKKAKTIKLKSGWAVYFVRSKGFIDHIAIVPQQPEINLNLYDGHLLNASAPPMGTGIGPLTNNRSDLSGIRIFNAIEFVDFFKKGSYKEIFIGPPPVSEKKITNAGKIAKNIFDTGLIDNQPIVYSFPTIPLLKKFFISYFDTQKLKTKITPIKKLKQKVKKYYCGSLVAEIWERAGINLPSEIKFFKIQGYSSFILFNWSKKNKSICAGLSWNN